uniref:Uncharacterized protein n=1 Tax=Alexandrium monilatum TaxID=311494 RepID=A0A7S4UHZ3_9DINO
MDAAELAAVVGRLEGPVRQELAKQLRQDASHGPPIGAHPTHGGGGRNGGCRGGRGGRGSGGYQQRSEGKGGGGRGKGGGPRLAPPPLDRPDELPPTVLETGEQVAFQAAMGMPWQLVGPSGRTFRWDLQDREAVPASTKQEIRGLLDTYAKEQGIPLHGDAAVKLALLRGEHWVSYAGGVSSAAGKTSTAPRAEVIAGADEGLGPEEPEGRAGAADVRALYC